MKKAQISFQIGKNGLNDNLIENIKKAFKNRENIKISVLKSAGHDREKIKEMAEEIISKLGKKYTYKIIGFTMFFKKWRKPKHL